MMDVSNFYRHVMDDVLRKTRENILIGVDEPQIEFVVDRLGSLWENKLVRLSAEARETPEPVLPLVNETPRRLAPTAPTLAPPVNKDVKAAAAAPSPYLPAPAAYSGFSHMIQDGKIVNPYEAKLPDRDALLKVEKKEKSASVVAPAPIRASPRAVNAPAPTPAAAVVIPAPLDHTVSAPVGATTGRQVKTPPVVTGRQVKTGPAPTKKRGAESEPSAPQPLDKKGKREDDEEEEDVDKDESEDDHESELGSDLDDDDDREPETDNMLLCQYTKVMRTKNRWKIQVKDAILRVHGRDHLLKEVNGEFQF
eukprot:TRINITY_DN4801_c0_g2_i2.p2 TRINITY_DN4801_c0_g2~~TRINITY_DN4801_c0_g2_i2.p2  ORF type:complete len:309 (+),score=99.45 TRINITY_DN4801_c0_g2_i2:115-1041(+)